MVTRRLGSSPTTDAGRASRANRDGSSSASAPSSSRSPAYAFTFTAPVTFGQNRSNVQNSATYEPTSTADGRNDAQSNTTTNSPRYTPSTTPSIALDQERTSGSQPVSPDPDHPLPSIERSMESSTPSLGGTSVQTPSTSARSTSASQSSVQEDLVHQVRGLRLVSTAPTAANSNSNSNSPLSSPQTIRSRTSLTPSIQLTHHPSHNSPRPPSERTRTESVVHAINALHVQESPSRSQSPTRRRRSGSNIVQRIHQVEDEEPPPSHFYRRDVQEALHNAKELMKQMARVLASSNLYEEQGSTIRNLHAEAVRLSEFRPPASRIVGLVGDSGVGKSSLINSLLDLKGFARASNSGVACTCVVTEYHYHSRQDWVLSVEYFSLMELRQQFNELLRVYRQHAALTPYDDISVEDREHLRKRAELAMSTFNASFQRRLDENPTTLLSMPFEDALDSMMAWVSQILTPERVGFLGMQSQETFDDIAQCSSRLNALTSETDGAGISCPWTFIRKIKVYVRAQILSQGLIVADLPGLRDLNSARENITERYIRQCHQVFAVARIGRAGIDPSIKEVFQLARRAALKNVGLVCTRSDDIQASEARRDWHEEKDRITAMISSIEGARSQIRSLQAELDDLGDVENLSDGGRQDFINIQQELLTERNSLKKHKLDLQRYIITTRNGKVASQLQSQYRNLLSEDALRIFCVSNMLYWERRAQPVRDSKPLLKLSGILDLRRYCIGMVADSHFQATRKYIQNEIPAFLGSIDLWVQAGLGDASIETKQQILDVISNIQRQIDELTVPESELYEISRTLTADFDNAIGLHMRQQATHWRDQARNTSAGWASQYHWGSFAAFCRNYGYHTTEAAGSHCWNEEAMETLVGGISNLLADFNKIVEEYLATVTKYVDDAYTAALIVATEAASSNERVRNAVSILRANMRHRKGLLLYRVEQNFEDYQIEVSESQADALSPLRTSIIGRLLDDTYHAANAEYGTGSDRRRKAIITNRFSSVSLFTAHRRRFRDKFVEISNALEQNTRETVSQHLTLIKADLDTLRDENVVLESEGNLELRMRLETELGTMRSTMERLHGVIGRATQTVPQDFAIED